MTTLSLRSLRIPFSQPDQSTKFVCFDLLLIILLFATGVIEIVEDVWSSYLWPGPGKGCYMVDFQEGAGLLPCAASRKNVRRHGHALVIRLIPKRARKWTSSERG